MIALAQTGSGKTGAFALPILQELIKTPQSFFACVLSPTRSVKRLEVYVYRKINVSKNKICCCFVLLKFIWVCCRELAIQIAEQFEALGSEIGVKCAVVSN